MKLNNTQVRRAVMALMVMVTAGSAPVFGDTNACYDQVLRTCTDVLKESRWWQKPAVGAFCTLMLAGCVGDDWLN